MATKETPVLETEDDWDFWFDMSGDWLCCKEIERLTKIPKNAKIVAVITDKKPTSMLNAFTIKFNIQDNINADCVLMIDDKCTETTSILYEFVGKFYKKNKINFDKPTYGWIEIVN
jgi:hypothetical protein